MTSAEAYQYVCALLVHSARGDKQAMDQLSHDSIKTMPDLKRAFNAAMSISYAAHFALADLTEQPLEEFLQSIALDSYSYEDVDDE